mgnify:CR=1 FL=1
MSVIRINFWHYFRNKTHLSCFHLTFLTLNKISSLLHNILKTFMNNQIALNKVICSPEIMILINKIYLSEITF